MELPLFAANNQSKWRLRLIAIGSTTLALVATAHRAREERRRLHVTNDPSTPALRSALRLCLLAALSIGIVLHLALFAVIVRHRRSPSVRAAQPVGLSFVALAGAAALAGGICLAAPPSFATCAMAEPLIFASVSTGGASLTGMVWRVERVVAPILMLGRGRSVRDDEESILRIVKRGNKAFISLLAQNPAQIIKGASTVRRKVTNGCLVKIIVFLALPQYLLQTLSLAFSSLRSYPAPAPYDLCARPSAIWPTVLGTVLTALPFFSAVITTTQVEGGIPIPPVLNQASAIRNIIYHFSLISVTIAPILAFDSIDMNVSTYISIYLLLGAVVPLSYFIIWPKLYPNIFSNELVDMAEQITQSGRACRSFSATTDENSSNGRFERALNLYKQGKIFEEMDMPNNSTKLYDEALAMWQSDKGENSPHFTGDFTAAEIQGIRSASDADLIASLLTLKANFYENATVQKAAKCYLKAIEIFEFAPAMESISERTTIFPSFHSIFRLLREEKLKRDFIFEKALAARFVEETKGSNCFHHACALAMNAEMKFRSGLPREALEEFNKMRNIYRVTDSKGIREASGVDVCALAHSRCALWHMEMGDESNAVKQCEFVIKLLDNLQSNDPKEMHAVLTPVIAVLGEKQGKRVRKVYEDHVVKLIRGSMPFFVRNALFVLATSDGTPEDNGTSWIMCNSNEHQEVNHLFTSLGLSLNTTAAEACLRLARQGNNGTGYIHDNFCEGCSQTLVIDKGLSFATLAKQGMKENDHLISALANAKNESVLTALETLAAEIGYNPGKGPMMKRVGSAITEYLNSRRKPIELLQLKVKKTLPHHLLLSHGTVAFVGLTHDSLASVFAKALAEEPRRKWEGVYIFYVADSLIDNFKPWNKGEAVSDHGDNSNNLHLKKLKSRKELNALLEDRTKELCFYEITQHCSFFGSWFGWRDPGGYIHVSPSIWGVNVKMCPSNGYRWELGGQPSHEYNAYSKGIENLLSSENPFAIPLKTIASEAGFEMRNPQRDFLRH